MAVPVGERVGVDGEVADGVAVGIGVAVGDAVLVGVGLTAVAVETGVTVAASAITDVASAVVVAGRGDNAPRPPLSVKRSPAPAAAIRQTSNDAPSTSSTMFAEVGRVVPEAADTGCGPEDAAPGAAPAVGGFGAPHVGQKRTSGPSGEPQR